MGSQILADGILWEKHIRCIFFLFLGRGLEFSRDGFSVIAVMSDTSAGLRAAHIYIYIYVFVW